MKKNAIASLALAFATAFVLADNLGTPSLVGDLSSSSDYVYTADEVDTLLSARVPATRTVNGHPLSADVTITAADIGVSPGANVGFASVGTPSKSVVATTSANKIVFDGENATVSVSEVSQSGGGAVVSIIVPDGSTSAKGVVQLSSATNSTSATLAATPAAVKGAIDAAKAYTDARAYTHPTYTARTGKPTANAAPGFGGTFTISQVTSDGTGHVTALTDRTITIPSATASTTAAGLMSATDKTALDALASGGVTKSAVAAALTAQGITSTDDIDTLNETIAELKKVIAAVEALR